MDLNITETVREKRLKKSEQRRERHVELYHELFTMCVGNSMGPSSDKLLGKYSNRV